MKGQQMLKENWKQLKDDLGLCLKKATEANSRALCTECREKFTTKQREYQIKKLPAAVTSPDQYSNS